MHGGHSHSGGHDHSHGYASTSTVLRASIIATAIYILGLVYAGLRADSLALLSEAGHNLSDFLALLLSWAAVKLAQRPANERKTYGYSRAGVLAAFVNALSLIGISGWIFYEAVHRFWSGGAVEADTMIWASVAGVILNGAITIALLKTSRDVNVRSVIVHEVGDTLSTLAVVFGGIAIKYTGLNWIDPALSIAIGVMIVWSSWGIIRETLNILLEGTPHGVDIEMVTKEITSVDGVIGVHDLHVWSIGSETHALSCHITIADIPPSVSERILREVNARLSRFHIHHTTIQFENVVCDIAHGCVIPVHQTGSHSEHPRTH